MENPDSSANSVRLDVAALNAELMDRGTTTERVEEILAEVSGHSDLGEPGIATDATSWEIFSDAQLADILANPHAAGSMKDEIADYVNSRDTRSATDD